VAKIKTYSIQNAGDRQFISMLCCPGKDGQDKNILTVTKNVKNTLQKLVCSYCEQVYQIEWKNHEADVKLISLEKHLKDSIKEFHSLQKKLKGRLLYEIKQQADTFTVTYYSPNYKNRILKSVGNRTERDVLKLIAEKTEMFELIED
jgi:uncharacterized protein YbaR (Trm112 family)